MSQELTGKIIADKYRIEELVREDNFGAVYRGTHLLMEKSVMIKILPTALAVDDNIVKTFSEEARINSHISHPNILSITDFGSDAENIVYIIMESADGENLHSALIKDGKFETNRAIRVTRQTAAALSVAHLKKVVHGQLKPENIILNHIGGIETVKVSDFGAMVASDEDWTIEQAKYLAPEQYADLAETDERSDIYALGVIFYEMLAGETPFSAETVTDLMLRKNEELPAPLSAFRNDVAAGIEPVILKALAKNPDARQQSAAEFVDELDTAFGFAAEQQETIIVPKAEAATANNNLWKTAFVVLAGISLLSAALIYATQTKQTNPDTQMQTDANGMPVQPLGAATGMNEQGVNNMLPYPMPGMDNTNMMLYPDQVQQMPGGDGYDPWGRGGSPPPGAPPPIYPQGGEVYLVPGNSNSPFMPGEYVIQVPKEANVNADVAPAPTKTPKENNANAKPSPTPTPAPDATPAATPKPKTSPPAEKPKDNPPSAT